MFRSVSRTQLATIDTNIFLVFFIFMSFVVGVAIQSLSAAFENCIYRRKHGGYPSSKMLDSEDTTFPEDFKSGVRRLAHDCFGVPENANGQHIFDLCYTYVIQNAVSKRVTQFFNMYSFARNMTVTMLIESLILFLWSGYSRIIEIFFLGLMSIGLAFLFYQRFIRYSGSFAMEVLRSFLVDRAIKQLISRSG